LINDSAKIEQPIIVKNLDIRFLENLGQRLKTGSRRSIYLNALPGRLMTRMDAADFEQLQEGLASAFLNSLLKSPKSQTILRFEPQKLLLPDIQRMMRRLNSISIENKDYYEEHGVETFSFGFPILLRRDSKDPKKIIKAPMFIWSLSLNRNWRKANEWVLERGEDYSIVSNFPLTAHVFNDTQIQLTPLYDHLTEDGFLDKDELAELIYSHYSQLLSKEKPELKDAFRMALDSPLMPIPGSESIESKTLEEPEILWSGIFGLFKAQKDSIIKDIEYYMSNLNVLETEFSALQQQLPEGRSSFMRHTFSMVRTDPSQQQLLHSLGKGENLVIQGPPGTGKSQTLTGIITNVISNGGRCLVVCEKKTAMEVLQNNLRNLGLGELSIIVEDIYRDRTPLVSSARERIQQQHPAYSLSPNYTRILQSCAAQIQRLQKFHEKLIVPVCGNERFADVVALYLQNAEKFPKSRLDNHLKPGNFTFSPNELERLVLSLRDAELLYKNLGTLQHPFNAFNDRFFGIANTHQVFAELKKSVSGLLFAVDGAQRDLLAYLFRYEKLLEDHYSEIMSQKAAIAEDITETIEAGMKASRYFFKKDKGAYRSFLAGISSKYKRLKVDKLEVLKNYVLLQKNHEKFNYFKHVFLDVKNIDKIGYEAILNNTKGYHENLRNWYSSKDAAIRDYVNKLSEQNIHPHINFVKEVKELTRNLDLFAQNFTKSQVFKVPFAFKSAVFRQRLDSLEELDKNLKSLEAKFESDFTVYHPLKYFWLNLDAAQQAAFTGMAHSGLKDWEDYFTSWYYYHLISAYADEFIPEENNYRNLCGNLKKELEDLRQAMLRHTLQFWRSKQTEQVKNFNRDKAPVKVHSLYNLRGNSGGRRTPLRQIFEADPDLFTAFYPVLMLSPTVCASMLPLKPGLFDAVIFDEASQLRLEDTFSALGRGTYKIISGDSQQMPPSDYFAASKNLIHDDYEEEDDENYDNTRLQKEAVDYLSSSESLLEYCIADGNYRERSLLVHYRSAHPYLIDFSNAAFYGSRLLPIQSLTDYRPIQFNAVNGIYKDSVNREEAKFVVERLLEIYRNSERNSEALPSVGVGTFNMLQRNLIVEMMQEYSMQDESNGTAFEALFTAGLFVKNLENIQGDERDIMLLSTTFGPTEEGNFIQNFGPINRELGYRLLNVIITRAKKHLEIFTSIPAQFYGRFRDFLGESNTGRGILYAYLAYAKAVSDADETSRNAVLKVVAENGSRSAMAHYSFYEASGYFAAQFSNTFAALLPEGYSLQRNIIYMGIKTPILINNPEGKTVMAIFPDVHGEQYSEEAYAWDFFKEERLQALGIQVARVWSLSWWKNKDSELKRLMSQLP
jgi:hypothetical protein